jgi:hypothetical protein
MLLPLFCATTNGSPARQLHDAPSRPASVRCEKELEQRPSASILVNVRAGLETPGDHLPSNVSLSRDSVLCLLLRPSLPSPQIRSPTTCSAPPRLNVSRPFKLVAMPPSAAFVTLAALFALSSQCLASSASVVVEKRSLSSGWTRSERTPSPSVLLPLRIALRQSNLDRLHGELILPTPTSPVLTSRPVDELNAVSDPASASYGKHWSGKEVASFFAPAEDSIKAVQAWLEGAGFAAHRMKLVDGRQWIAMDVTVEEAEGLLETEYRSYDHVGGEKHIGTSPTRSVGSILTYVCTSLRQVLRSRPCTRPHRSHHPHSPLVSLPLPPCAPQRLTFTCEVMCKHRTICPLATTTRSARPPRPARVLPPRAAPTAPLRSSTTVAQRLHPAASLARTTVLSSPLGSPTSAPISPLWRVCPTSTATLYVTFIHSHQR